MVRVTAPAKPDTEKPETSDAGKLLEWPRCPVCDERELGCLSGDAWHKHSLDCALFCYMCGKDQGIARAIVQAETEIQS